MCWRSLALATSLLMLAPLPTQAATLSTPASPKATHKRATYSIGVTNFQFEPKQLVVPIGSKVSWTNHDEEPHIVVSTNGRFKNSPALDTGDSYSAVFSKPGTYAYFCSIHPQMTGKIVVR